MNHKPTTKKPPSDKVTCLVSEITIAQLVGQVYELAPAAERSRLLEHLLRPLGVLSLVAIANGIFAKIRFRSGWPDLHVQLEDAQNVQASDVITLVDHVQQVSVHVVDGLADMLAASPVMAGSAAAALLITVLVQRARNRRAGDRGLPPSLA
ncbi:MAG: hypothetical protein GZ093_12030 [Rhodoferax sp.]|uniref:hypothetical protein n=1 Tax=Rhodoferax sp. TaxID=50421 RepID=UPI0014001CD8|nr:hypothetical protein [Rhodoferax sp.]NDP39460.1 hypothetical protein [Rhodoferax sp.]